MLPKHICALRVRSEIANGVRDLALFDLATDGKLRGCDLGQVKERAAIVRSKTHKRDRFEISEGTRKSLAAWLEAPLMSGLEHPWRGRLHERLHISTRQCARRVKGWISSIGLEPNSHGTHSMRRTKVAQIYRTTGNQRTLQLLLRHTRMDSAFRHHSVELEDALGMVEAIEI